jgi:hypothetical protein
MPPRPHGLAHLRRAIAALTGRPHPALRRHRDEAEELRASSAWLHQPGVHGIGIARRVTNGERKRDLALTVFVVEKRPATDLAAPVPEIIDAPALGGPVRTDVVAIGRARLDAGPATQPIVPGCGISRMNVPSGTFGCLVQRGGDSARPFLLSAGHVLAPLGARIDDPILQPGFAEGGRPPASTLATLAAWSNHSITNDDYPNFTDAAIARVTSPALVDATIPQIGRPTGRTDTLRIGTTIQMLGRVSGYQQASVTALDFSVEFVMTLPSGESGRVGFSDLVLCTKYSAQGDSGAAVFNMNRQVVGLHMGATDTTSFFCRIGNVCAELGVDIVT